MDAVSNNSVLPKIVKKPGFKYFLHSHLGSFEVLESHRINVRQAGVQPKSHPQADQVQDSSALHQVKIYRQSKLIILIEKIMNLS